MRANFYVRGMLANLVTLAILLACLFHDRKLVERRMKIGPVAEQRFAQKVISALIVLGFVAFVLLPARIRPSLRLVAGCTCRICYRKRCDRTVVRTVLFSDEVKQLCGF
jgi:protein-S-isoprenylcysteine O-methyltransferase Ste14